MTRRGSPEGRQQHTTPILAPTRSLYQNNAWISKLHGWSVSKGSYRVPTERKVCLSGYSCPLVPVYLDGRSGGRVIAQLRMLETLILPCQTCVQHVARVRGLVFAAKVKGSERREAARVMALSVLQASGVASTTRRDVCLGLSQAAACHAVLGVFNLHCCPALKGVFSASDQGLAIAGFLLGSPTFCLPLQVDLVLFPYILTDSP
ncbi:hypothetical protein BKA70DRAFT_453876 [Coprinopsis sp. MPI-PUGE-AT-0042]|nr:hypothetical protein BKA70DRAFT_453876 [Coprinopsis sp. MPI-PUGE-AT-0042]